MGRTVKYKLIPTPHFVKDFSKLDEFVKKKNKNLFRKYCRRSTQ